MHYVYINDLPKLGLASTVSMYAEDTGLSLQSSDISKLTIALNNDLKLLNTWMECNKLSVSVVKTKPMRNGTKPRHNNIKSADMELSLNICGSELDVVEKIKYLVVQVDNRLDWKEHIKVASAKVSKALGLLQHTKRFRFFRNTVIKHC